MDSIVYDLPNNFPVAHPQENQHTQLDFLNNTSKMISLFGGEVNPTGTEFAIRNISDDTYADNDEIERILMFIASHDNAEFELAETAKSMSRLFRVHPGFFRSEHDREQEILNGYIQRAKTYNALRSFAWTLAAYCDKNNVEPAALGYSVLDKMVNYIERRACVNYTADSYCSTLCSGDDLNVYYLPDSIPESIKNKLTEIRNSDVEEDDIINICEVRSLEGLRRDLEYMYPAIRTIYDELEVNRDMREQLSGGTADILYAWCSVAYGARSAMFTEDGPVNCWWDKPGSEDEHDLGFAIHRAKWQKKTYDQWMGHYGDLVTRNPIITFEGKTFVFAGVESYCDWIKVLEALVARGGIHRTSISGKTDYLVVNPYEGRDAKVIKAQEQQVKGSKIDIVLMNDFFAALDMDGYDPDEMVAEVEKACNSKVDFVGPIREVDRPAVMHEIIEEYDSIAETESYYTYEKGIRFENDAYSIDIPDGFELLEDVDGREFIAYLSCESCNYIDSDFVIMGGKDIRNDLCSKFRTVEEYMALALSFKYANTSQFDTGFSTFDRYSRRDLPGGIAYLIDEECAHVIGFFGIDDFFKVIRIQDNVYSGDEAGEKARIREIFNHMKAKKPVELYKPLDDSEYIDMRPGDDIYKSWIDEVNDTVARVGNARNNVQSGIINQFQKTLDLGRFNSELREMLDSYRRCFEHILGDITAIYALKKHQYPECEELDLARDQVRDTAELATQYVNLEGERIASESRFGNVILKVVDGPVTRLIAVLLNQTACEINPAVLELLKEIMSSSQYDEDIEMIIDEEPDVPDDAAAQAKEARRLIDSFSNWFIVPSESDKKKAYELSKKSADQNNYDGKLCLADCYWNGYGVPCDYEKAQKIYKDIAGTGYAPGLFELALHSEEGYQSAGMIKNLYMAADQGYEPALEYMKENMMTVSDYQAKFDNPQNTYRLERTSEYGRADNCEALRAGSTLTYKCKRELFLFECFYNGKSVGEVYAPIELIALLELDRINLDIVVTSVIPKSRKGRLARSADVVIQYKLTEKKPESPEEIKARLERERIEAEERRAEEARLKAEEEQRLIAETEALQHKEEELRRKADQDARLREIEELKRLEHERLEEEEWANAKLAREAEEARIRAEHEKRLAELKAETAKKDRMTVGVVAVVVVLLLAVVAFKLVIPGGKYSDACEKMDNKQYAEAIAILEGLGNYKDSAEMLKTAKHYQGFIDKAEIVDRDYIVAGDYYPGIAVHTEPNKSSSEIERIPDDTEVHISYKYKKYGYIENGSNSGWINLDYLVLASGEKDVNQNKYFDNAKKVDTKYVITSDYYDGIALHKKPTKSSAVLERLDEGTTFKVKYIYDGYGYTKYNGVSGWINLEYAEQV